jgi:hypothetical protein
MSISSVVVGGDGTTVDGATTVRDYLAGSAPDTRAVLSGVDGRRRLTRLAAQLADQRGRLEELVAREQASRSSPAGRALLRRAAP